MSQVLNEAVQVVRAWCNHGRCLHNVWHILYPGHIVIDPSTVVLTQQMLTL